MKVTAIKQQVKRTDRYSIYIDDIYKFSLSESQLLSSGLHSGQELTRAEVAAYTEESATGKLFDKMLNLLSIRPRSEWELREYLRRKDASPEQVAQIIVRCRQLSYIDDERFARQWLESRRLGAPRSQRKLRSELLAKRIAPTIVDQVLAEDRNTIDERDVLRELVAKKRARYPDGTKFMQYLARQGFSYDDIKQVLKDSSSSGP